MTEYNEDRIMWILDGFFLTVFPHLTKVIGWKQSQTNHRNKISRSGKALAIKHVSSFNLGLASSIFTIFISSSYWLTLPSSLLLFIIMSSEPNPMSPQTIRNTGYTTTTISSIPYEQKGQRQKRINEGFVCCANSVKTRFKEFHQICYPY